MHSVRVGGATPKNRAKSHGFCKHELTLLHLLTLWIHILVLLHRKNLFFFYKYILHHTRDFSWFFVMDWSREIAVHLFKIEFIVYKWYVLKNISTYWKNNHWTSRQSFLVWIFSNVLSTSSFIYVFALFKKKIFR